MGSSYPSDDDDFNVHIRHQGRLPPQPVRHVPSPSVIRSYYGVPVPSTYLGPEQHNLVVARPRSRERSRDRQSPLPAPNQPIITSDRIYHEVSSEEDNVFVDSRRFDTQRGAFYRRNRSRSTHRSRSSISRSRSRSKSRLPRHEDWLVERTRIELEQLHVAQQREKEDRRLIKEHHDEAELRRALHDLDVIRRREEREEMERMIGKEIELKRLKHEEEEIEAKRLRDKHAEAAVERYKQQQSERLAQEKKLKEESEKEYKRRLTEDLIKSGLDEKAVAAILNQEKIPDPTPASSQTAAAISSFPAHEHHASQIAPIERPTYTRMARKYLSMETLRELNIVYDIDTDPEYLIIKRWVPEWEQDQFWRHTKHLREKRGKLLSVEDKKHHHHKEKGPEFEWVRKKHDRRRSKSPGLLMYLAGAKPA